MIGLEWNSVDRPRADLPRDARGDFADELRSSPAWLVLALVIERPSHGYEISQRYEDRFGGFLPVSSASVYAALRRLQERGFVERVALEASGRSRGRHIARRSFRATADGARAYRGWVAERMREDSRRSEMLGKIASVGFLGTGALLGVVHDYEQECMEEMWAMPAPLPLDEPRQYRDMAELVEDMLAEQRRLEMRAQLDWVTYARKTIRAHERRVAEQRGVDP